MCVWSFFRPLPSSILRHGTRARLLWLSFETVSPSRIAAGLARARVVPWSCPTRVPSAPWRSLACFCRRVFLAGPRIAHVPCVSIANVEGGHAKHQTAAQVLVKGLSKHTAASFCFPVLYANHASWSLASLGNADDIRSDFVACCVL